MIYVIGAVAACLGIGVGLALGYLRWGPSSLLSLEERIDLQNEQLRLQNEIASGKATPEIHAQLVANLTAITRRLDRARRQLDAAATRKAKAKRRGLRKMVGRDLD